MKDSKSTVSQYCFPVTSVHALSEAAQVRPQLTTENKTESNLPLKHLDERETALKPAQIEWYRGMESPLKLGLYDINTQNNTGDTILYKKLKVSLETNIQGIHYALSKLVLMIVD